MANCWIFDLKCYLFNIYIRDQPRALPMHNLTLNMSLCADVIRRGVFAPIFPALILKGIWTKRNKEASTAAQKQESTWWVQPVLFGPTEDNLLRTWKSDTLQSVNRFCRHACTRTVTVSGQTQWSHICCNILMLACKQGQQTACL